MEPWLFFGYHKGNVSLSINGRNIIYPKRSITLPEIKEASILRIEKPAKNKWIPYIFINNLLGLREKHISYTQEMYESFTIDDNGLIPTTEDLIEEYGLYKIFYRKGYAIKSYIYQPKRLNDRLEIYLLDKVMYRGEQILKNTKWVPIYNIEGKCYPPSHICRLLHELVNGIGEDIAIHKGKLID